MNSGKTSNLIKFLALLVFAALLAGAYQLGVLHERDKEQPQPERVNIITLGKELSQIQELACYEYSYDGLIEDAQKLLLAKKYELPFTENSYKVYYKGVIKAGFDMDKLEIAGDGKTKVFIQLPSPRILDQYANNDSVRVIDQKNNIFNPIDMQGIFDLIVEQNGEQLKAAEADGIYEKSIEHAKTIITDFIQKVYGSDIEVIFR